MPKKPNDRLVLVPTDVKGSWAAMLKIYENWEKNGEFFEWENTGDYRRSRALRSKPMHELLIQLSETHLSKTFRVGGGLFGVVTSLPFDESREFIDSRVVALNVTEQRQIEIRLLDVSEHSVRPPVLSYVVCDLCDAVKHMLEFTQLLHGTQIKRQS